MTKATLTGTLQHPQIKLTFDWDATHATTGEPLRDWIKTLPGRRWDPTTNTWHVWALGDHPQQTLIDAGLTPIDKYGNPTTCTNLTRPLATPHPNDPDHLWELHPRLGGRHTAEANLPVETIWSTTHNCWLVPPAHLVGPNGQPHEWLDVDGPLTTAAHHHPTPHHSRPPLAYDHTLDGLRGVPISDLHQTSKVTVEAMGHVGIRTVHDLLHQVPRRYIDLTNPTTVDDAAVGGWSAVLGTILRVTPPPNKGGVLKVQFADPTGGRLSLRWFNAAWMARRLVVGRTVVVFGRVEQFTSFGGRLVRGMTNPILETVDDHQVGQVLGVYSASGKHDLTTWQVRAAATEAVSRLGTLTDPVPPEILAARGLPSRTDAYRLIHDPPSVAAARLGRDRLAYDELLRLQLILAASRARRKAEQSFAHSPATGLLDRFVGGLPYPLTGAQTRAIEEIRADMCRPVPMARLLMGDVGAGKTVVSVAAMLISADSGFQSALVAPTEILASQHHTEIARLCEPLGVNVGLLTNKVTGKARKSVLAGLADGTIQVVVGTHALLADPVRFARLSCVVVDEQHRFGVEQRGVLRAKGGGRFPDMLYASATPVPRTAAMTVFGDLDVSTLDELPAGRVPVRTVQVAGVSLGDPLVEPWVTVRGEVAAGRQAFVVTPLVKDSLARGHAAAHETAAALEGGALRGLRVGVVTGKDKPADRQATMGLFAAGGLDVLVATTVIEVGVNVPNATVMVVLGADRFGLAQLHQLRGRVGRGEWPGSCFLVGDPRTSAGRDRLAAMVATTDGFVLAERDLEIRGVGSMAGADQSGRGRDLRVADVLEDGVLVGWAKEDAGVLVDGDPWLLRRPGLRAEVLLAVGEEGAEWLLSA